MRSAKEAKEIAEKQYDWLKMLKCFEFSDHYVFTTDYADNDGLLTPGMPLLQVEKETGKCDIYVAKVDESLEKAKIVDMG